LGKFKYTSICTAIGILKDAAVAAGIEALQESGIGSGKRYIGFPFSTELYPVGRGSAFCSNTGTAVIQSKCRDLYRGHTGKLQGLWRIDFDRYGIPAVEGVCNGNAIRACSEAGQGIQPFAPGIGGPVEGVGQVSFHCADCNLAVSGTVAACMA
jgi:hypothetical protein